eukprot:4128157-Alexandrium_andersonii.AAC.2
MTSLRGTLPKDMLRPLLSSRTPSYYQPPLPRTSAWCLKGRENDLSGRLGDTSQHQLWAVLVSPGHSRARCTIDSASRYPPTAMH